MWQKYEDVPIWTDIFDTIDGEVKSFPNDSYNAPSAVMRSVSIPVNTSRMDLWWGSDPSMNVGLNSKFFVVLYFAEIEAIRQANVRQFNVFLDNNILADAFSPPKYMLATMLSGTVQGLGLHNVSLVATGTYRLKPAISAMEIYLLRSLNESATNSDDGNTFDFQIFMFPIKIDYQNHLLIVYLFHNIYGTWFSCVVELKKYNLGGQCRLHTRLFQIRSKHAIRPH
jgi:hypothetical protein